MFISKHKKIIAIIVLALLLVVPIRADRTEEAEASAVALTALAAAAIFSALYVYGVNPAGVDSALCVVEDVWDAMTDSVKARWYEAITESARLHNEYYVVDDMMYEGLKSALAATPYDDEVGTGLSHEQVIIGNGFTANLDWGNMRYQEIAGFRKDRIAPFWYGLSSSNYWLGFYMARKIGDTWVTYSPSGTSSMLYGRAGYRYSNSTNPWYIDSMMSWLTINDFPFYITLVSSNSNYTVNQLIANNDSYINISLYLTSTATQPDSSLLNIGVGSTAHIGNFKASEIMSYDYWEAVGSSVTYSYSGAELNWYNPNTGERSLPAPASTDLTNAQLEALIQGMLDTAVEDIINAQAGIGSVPGVEDVTDVPLGNPADYETFWEWGMAAIGVLLQPIQDVLTRIWQKASQLATDVAHIRFFFIDFWDNLLAWFVDAATFMFTPPDDFFTDFFADTLAALETKLSIDSYASVFGNAQSISAGNAPIITCTIMGQTVTILDLSPYALYRDTVKSWLKGFFYILCCIFWLNLALTWIRGGGLLSMGFSRADYSSGSGVKGKEGVV